MARNSELMARPAPMAPALRPDPIAQMAKSEIETAVAFAMEHPRDIERFLTKAKEQAIMTEDIAKSCVYAKPIGGKSINGPSVRLSEIVMSNYQHLRVATRFVEDAGTRVVCQAIIIDLENNNQLMDEVHVPIMTKDGNRYSEDMIATAIASGKAKARRNVIFQIVPRAYTDEVYELCRKVIRGELPPTIRAEGKKKITLDERRENGVAYFEKLGVPRDRVLARFGKQEIKQLTVDDVETLVGYATALKEPGNDTTLEEMFPEPEHVETAKVTSTRKATAKRAEPIDAEEAEVSEQAAPKAAKSNTDTADIFS